jgi:hypothetical protein
MPAAPTVTVCLSMASDGIGGCDSTRIYGLVNQSLVAYRNYRCNPGLIAAANFVAPEMVRRSLQSSNPEWRLF